jgi:hypothetical protein
MNGETDARWSTFLFGALSLITVLGGYWLIMGWEDPSWVVYLLPVSYLLLGALIKFGDQAYDEGTFSRRTAFALAFPSGVLLGTLMALDNGTATIAIGLLLSLMLAGKYDNRGFVAGFLISISISILAMFYGLATPDIAGVLLVGMASYLDEWADARAEGGTGILPRILCQRPFLKVMVLLLCVSGILDSYLYFLIFLSFDFGYSFMEYYSRIIGAVAHAKL